MAIMGTWRLLLLIKPSDALQNGSFYYKTQKRLTHSSVLNYIDSQGLATFFKSSANFIVQCVVRARALQRNLRVPDSTICMFHHLTYITLLSTNTDVVIHVK